MASSSGFTRAKAASSAPTMKRDSPRSAWLASRPTGASIHSQPRAAVAAASRSVTSGSMVLMSMTAPWRRRCARTPSGPATTCSTIAEVGSIVITTSLPAATAATVGAARAPRSASARTGAGFTSCTRREKPLRHRLAAIGRPMLPSPTKPIVSAELDADILHLRVTDEGLEALFATVAALFVSAKRQLDAAAGAVRVDVDLAGLDPRRERHRLVDVARPDAGHQAVLTAIGH